MFCHFRAGHTPFLRFQQSACVCTKQHFQPGITFEDVRTGRTTFSAFQQSTPVCTKQHFQPEIRTFRHFGTGTSVFSVYTKVHDLVLTSVFRTRSARFVILALGAPLFGNLLQSA